MGTQVTFKKLDVLLKKAEIIYHETVITKYQFDEESGGEKPFHTLFLSCEFRCPVGKGTCYTLPDLPTVSMDCGHPLGNRSWLLPWLEEMGIEYHLW